MTMAEEKLDMLNEFAAGEDEFDVDLMACGCRLAAGSIPDFSIYDLVRLHNLDHDKMVALIGALVDHGKVDSKTLFSLADKAAKGKIKEIDERTAKKGNK